MSNSTGAIPPAINPAVIRQLINIASREDNQDVVNWLVKVYDRDVKLQLLKRERPKMLGANPDFNPNLTRTHEIIVEKDEPFSVTVNKQQFDDYIKNNTIDERNPTYEEVKQYIEAHYDKVGNELEDNSDDELDFSDDEDDE